MMKHKDTKGPRGLALGPSVVLCFIVLSFATPCLAQDTPAWEFFGGYSFQRSDVRQYFRSTPIIYTFRGRYTNLNGWALSVTENRNHWFGGTLDVRGHYKTPQLLGTTNREQMYSILYGPRFSLPALRFIPFALPSAHILLGAARAKVRVAPVGPNATDTSFAIAAGGSADMRLGKRAGVRLQADYFRTDLLGTRPDSLRASAGVVFYLGKRE